MFQRRIRRDNSIIQLGCHTNWSKYSISSQPGQRKPTAGTGTVVAVVVIIFVPTNTSHRHQILGDKNVNIGVLLSE